MNIQDYIIYHTAGNIYWKSRDGVYLGCNLNFAKTARVDSPDAILGKTDRDLFLDDLGEEGIKKLVDTDQYVMNHDVVKTIEEIGIDQQGNIAFFLTNKRPLRNDKGDIIGLAGNSIQITKYKKTELAKSEFISNMSHDLRTPLSGILGLSDLALEEISDDDRNKRYFEDIHQCAEQLLNLANSIIGIASLDLKGSAPQEEAFAIQGISYRVHELMKPALRHKGLQYNINFVPGLPLILYGCEHFIFYIMVNLVGNAVKFTEKGTVKIKCWLNKIEQQEVVERAWLFIEVSDTGQGIPKDQQSEIFDAFRRLTPSYKGLYEGAGLGLYMVKRMLEILGGEIALESEVGKGSTFTCKVPVSFED